MMRLNTSTYSTGLIIFLSQSAISLFNVIFPSRGIFPVEYCEMLYGGSVRIKSTD